LTIQTPRVSETGREAAQFLAGHDPAEERDDLSADAAVYTSCKRLEALGLVTRSRDSADERQVRVKLTEAGRRLRLRASDIVQSVRDATGLQDKQVRRLVTEIDALRTALESERIQD
jgi:DNA-binding MarR family transcriptional regulator